MVVGARLVVSGGGGPLVAGGGEFRAAGAQLLGLLVQLGDPVGDHVFVEGAALERGEVAVDGGACLVQLGVDCGGFGVAGFVFLLIASVENPQMTPAVIGSRWTRLHNRVSCPLVRAWHASKTSWCRAQLPGMPDIGSVAFVAGASVVRETEVQVRGSGHERDGLF